MPAAVMNIGRRGQLDCRDPPAARRYSHRGQRVHGFAVVRGIASVEKAVTFAAAMPTSRFQVHSACTAENRGAAVLPRYARQAGGLGLDLQHEVGGVNVGTDGVVTAASEYAVAEERPAPRRSTAIAPGLDQL